MDTKILLMAYRQGIFPMSVSDEGEIGWFSPDPRAIIPLDDGFHIPGGLRRRLKRNPFETRLNTAFEEVIKACATVHGRTWISGEIMRSYIGLHRRGHAHSVEMWREGRLAGGLYGVQIGGAFFGESMFRYETDASKVALVVLVEHLRAQGFVLLDTQWTTPHLLQFGATEISRKDYLKRLEEAVQLPCRF